MKKRQERRRRFCLGSMKSRFIAKERNLCRANDVESKKEEGLKDPFAFSPTRMPFHIPYLFFDSGRYARTAAISPGRGWSADSCFVRGLFQNAGLFHQLVKRQYMISASAYVVRTSIRLQVITLLYLIWLSMSTPFWMKLCAAVSQVTVADVCLKTWMQISSCWIQNKNFTPPNGGNLITR